MTPIETYVDELSAVGPQRFRLLHPHPVLVSVMDLSPEDHHEYHTRSGQRDLLFGTLGDGDLDRGTLEEEKPLSERRYVWELAKRPGGPFAERIGIGRTRATDVQLAFTRVSKFHAYFVIAEGQPITLTDGGSTNGTFVNDVQLSPKSPAIVGDGELIRFGPLTFELFTADRFAQAIRELAESR